MHLRMGHRISFCADAFPFGPTLSPFAQAAIRAPRLAGTISTIPNLASSRHAFSRASCHQLGAKARQPGAALRDAPARACARTRSAGPDTKARMGR
jgi:hypothetical protein